MKKFSQVMLCITTITLFTFWTGCKKSNNEVNWTDEEKASYQEVLSVQDQAGGLLEEYFQTMDSLDAIDKVQQYFANDPSVSQAAVNSQGIAVQYANGMRGGLLIRPKDDKGEVGGEQMFPEPVLDNNQEYKSLVNKRKMILIDPHYFERSYYTDQVYSITSSKLGKVGMELTTFYKNEEATIDRFTELSGYGIIQIYSHGLAWPNENNITDVYLLTGETANEGSSAKYWDELKKGNIPVMKVSGPNKYLVSPKFIRDHNDFSKDTVLFYGGFCYSFLGNWPDIIESFADGAYMGFDWSVYTHNNANWSVNSIALMCDTSLTEPMNLEAWMQDPTVEKSYWNDRDSRTVEIHYAGDGNLTLWGDTNVSIIALSPDGKPVSVPGEAGEAYPFRCEVVSSVSELEFIWDIGDGSEPVAASNEVNITWAKDGQYDLKVKVKNQSNGELIGSAKVVVKIGEDDVKQYVTSCNTVTVEFGPQSAFLWESKTGGQKNRGDGDMEWNINSLVGLSGSTTIDNITNTFTGTLSSDGQTLSFTAVKERIGVAGEVNIKYTLEVKDYPLDYFDPPNTGWGWASYSVKDNQDIQNYVTSFEGHEWDDFGYDYNLVGVNWGGIITLRIGFHKE